MRNINFPLNICWGQTGENQPGGRDSIHGGPERFSFVVRVATTHRGSLASQFQGDFLRNACVCHHTVNVRNTPAPSESLIAGGVAGVVFVGCMASAAEVLLIRSVGSTPRSRESSPG